MEVAGAILPWVIIIGVFYFFLIRPQRKQKKQHQNMLDNLQEGDDVITAGGIKGKIIKIKDNVVTLEISPDVNIEISKSSISQKEKPAVEEE